jgi:hypothetical protein
MRLDCSWMAQLRLHPHAANLYLQASCPRRLERVAGTITFAARLLSFIPNVLIYNFLSDTSDIQSGIWRLKVACLERYV